MGADCKLEVAIFVMDGMWAHDLASVLQVFGGVMEQDGTEPCHITCVASKKRVRLDHGLSIEAVLFDQYSIQPDIVCVPGFANPYLVPELLKSDLKDEDTGEDTGRDWLATVYKRGVEAVALGTGPFVLAWAGLLCDVYCTVHRKYVSEFEAFCQEARLRSDQLLVHDAAHRIWTCAGGASCLDICLEVLMHVGSRGSARRVADTMNLWSPHALETRQDALGLPEALAEDRKGREIVNLAMAIRRHLNLNWSIAEMAWYAGMSTRTFQRQFQRAMGTSPTRWLIAERVSAACSLLEESDLSISDIAQKVGMGDAAVLRRHFSAAMGVSPSEYRKRV